MNNDLSILVKTMLQSTSVTNLKNEVENLVKNLSKLNIEIKIDDKIISTINNISKVMESMNVVTQQVNKSSTQYTQITKELDGSIKKYSETIKANGEIIQKTTEIIDKNKIAKQQNAQVSNSISKETEAIKKLNSEYGNLIRTIKLKKANGDPLRQDQIYLNSQTGVKTTVTSRPGQENTYRSDNDYGAKKNTDALKEQMKLARESAKLAKESNDYQQKYYKVQQKAETDAKKLKQKNINETVKQLQQEQKERIKNENDYIKLLRQTAKQKLDAHLTQQKILAKESKDFIKEASIRVKQLQQEQKQRDKLQQDYIKSLRQTAEQKLKAHQTSIKLIDQENSEFLRGIKLKQQEQQKFIANQERISKQLNTKSQNALGLGVKFNNLSPEQLAPLEKALLRYQNLIKEFQQKNISGQLVSDKDIERLQRLENAIKRVYDNTRIASKDSRGFNFEQYPKMTNAVHGATNAQNYYNQSIIQGKKLLESSVQETEKYIKVTQRLRQGSEISNITAYINKATGETHKFSESMKSLLTRTYDLGSAFKTAMEKFAIWMASGTVLFQSWHFLKDGISYVNQYNKALTELSVVYMQTQNQVEKLGEKLHNLSIEMGVSTQEVAKGAVEFARQGLSEAESIKRMETAMKYAKISNLDFSTSARILTATVNSMGVSAERAADIFSYMGDATATGADEIGEAFMRMGGSIGSTDIEFEKAASWVATISSKTRESAYTIGNSVKSLVARFQQLKEMGFAEDDGTQVNQVSKSLATIGVQLMDTQGQFRNFGAVMDEVGNKWKSLDSRHRAYISTTLAGTYQQARFLNLMENYGESIDLYKESLNQAGIANKKFDLIQQGTENQLTKMKNTFEGVWLSTFSSQGIRNAIAILTGIGNAINNVIKTIGFLPPVIVATTLAIAAFNNNIRTTLILNGTQFIGLLKQQIALWMQNSNAIARNATGASLATVAFNGLKLSLAGLNTALLTTGRFFAGALIPIAIITAVTYAITKLGEVVWDLSHKTENAKEEFNKLKDELKTLNIETTEINNLIKSYEELSGGLAKTKEEKDKLASVTQRLSELYPEVITNYDLEGKAVEANIKLVKELLKVKEQEREDKKNDLKNTFYDIGEDTFDNLLKNKEKIKKVNEELNNLLSLKNNRDGIDKNLLNVQEFILFGDTEDENISELRKNISKFTSESRKDFETLASQIQATYSEFDNFKNIDSASLNLFIRDVLNNVEDLNINNLREFMDYIGKTELPNVFADYNKGLEDYKKGSIEYDVLVKKQEISIATLEKVFKDLGITAPETLKKIKEDLLELPNIKDSTDSFTDFDSAVKSLTGSYKESSEEISEYHKILSDVTKGNEINFESVKKLIETNPKLITAIKNENGQMTVSADALRTLIKERTLERKVAIESQIEKTKIINKATLDRIKSYGIEIEQIHNLADAEAAVIEMGKKMASNVGKMTPEEEKQAVVDLSISRAEIEKNKQEIEKYKKISKELIDSMGSPNFGIIKDSKDTASAKSAESLAWEKVTNEIKTYDNALKSLEDTTSNMIKGSKDRRDALHNENLKIKEQINYLKQQRDGLNAPITTNNTSSITTTTTGNTSSALSKYKISPDISNAVNTISKKYNVDPALIYAIGQHETGWGKLGDGRKGMYTGYGSYDSGSDYGNAGLEKQITGTVKKMLAWGMTPGNVSLEKLNQGNSGNLPTGIYATDKNWQNSIWKYYKEFNNGTVTDTSLSKSELSYEKLAEDRIKHQEEINAKILELEKKFAQNSKEWYTDLWQESDNIITEFENKSNFSKSKSESMSKSSPEYRDELELQKDNIIGVQKQLAEQAKQMDQAIENMKKGITEGTFKDEQFLKETIEKRKALSAEWWNKQKEIVDKQAEITSSEVEEVTNKIDEYNLALSIAQSQQEMNEKGTEEYNNALKNETIQYYNIESALKAKLAIYQKELADTALGTLRYQELQKAIADTTQEIINNEKALYNKKKQIIDDTISLMKKAYEKQKDIAVDTVDKQMDAEDKRHNQIKENLKDELDQYEESIQQKLKLLDELSSTEDYDDNISKLNKEKLEIQKQIDYLGNDTSYETKAKREKLLKELSDKEIEIEKTQKDREKELRKNSLNNQLDNYKKDVKKKEDAEDDKYDAEKERLEKIKKETEKHYQDMIDNEINFSNISKELMKGNIDNTISELQRLLSFVKNNISNLGQGVGNTLASEINNSINQLTGNLSSNNSGNTGNTGSSTTSHSEYYPYRTQINNIIYDKKMWKQGYETGNQQMMLDAENEAKIYYNQIPGYIQTLLKSMDYDTANSWFKKNVYHEGGVVLPEGKSPSKIQDIINKLFNVKPGEQVIKNLIGEVQVPTQNIARNFIPNMQNFVNSFMPNITPSIATSGGNNYYLTVEVANMNANNKKDIDNVSRFLIDGVRKLGKQI